MAHPVAVLQEFFQKAAQSPQGQIAYEFSDYCTDQPIPEKRFVCNVKTPRIVVADSGIVRCVLEEQVFQGEGRKKADAKRDAAANALSFLQEQPIWEAQHRPPPLQDVLNACFTNKGIQQDPDLKAWWCFCQQYRLNSTTAAAAAAVGPESVPMTCPVSLPLTAMANSKHLINWIKQQQAQQQQQQQQQEQQHQGQQQQQQQQQGGGVQGIDVSDTAEVMRHIRALLQEAAAAGTLAEGVSLEQRGLSVSRQQQQQQQSAHGTHVSPAGTGSAHSAAAAAVPGVWPPVPSTLSHELWDESPAAVLVPADTRSPVSEVTLQSHHDPTASTPDLLHQVCHLLQLAHPHSLVVWGRVGPRVTHPTLPEQWEAAQQQWNKVHTPLLLQQQQHQQQQESAALASSQQHKADPGEGQGKVGGHVLDHLSGGTSVLLAAGKHKQSSGHQQQQQQQQQQELEAAGGGAPAAVVLGTSRQASASTLLNEPQPPQKRMHTAAQGPQPSSLSRESLLAEGGGPAVMDWEGTQQEAEEVRGPPAGHTAGHSILPPETSPDTTTAAAADPAAAAAAAGSQGPHMIDIGPPIMYSVFYEDQGLAEAAGLNLRASWLAGRRVYGPVLLAGTGIMRGAGTYNVIKWRSYTADTFWAGLSSLLPAAAYSSRTPQGGCTLTRLPSEYRSSCWVGPQPHHLMEMYINKHAHWATQLLPRTLSLQQQQQQAEPLDPNADVATEDQSAVGAPDGTVSKLSGLLDYVTTVEDATELASNSPTGFNCRVKLTVKPLASAAAAAAGSTGSSSAGSWFRVLGCGSEEEGLAVLENLSVSIDSEAGFRAAEAHVEVQEGQLVVVAGSGLTLGPVDAQNIAALAAAHLVTALDAAALTATAPQLPSSADAPAAAEAAAAELEAMVMATEAEAAAAAAGDAAAAAAAAAGGLSGLSMQPGVEQMLVEVAGTAEVMPEAAAAAAGVAAGAQDVDMGAGSGDAGDGGVEVLWQRLAVDPGVLQPAVGLVAKINAHLYLPATSGPIAAAAATVASTSTPQQQLASARPTDPGCYSLDVLRGYSLLLGSGSAMSELEEVVMGLTVGAAAQKRVHVCLQGPDVLHKYTPIEAVLAVHLLDVRQAKPSTAAAAAAAAAGEQGPAMFDPPLGLQRRRLVSELVKRCNMSTVVDLGCGDGGLLKHLLCECGFTHLAHIVGVDVSAKDLAAAARRLEGMQSHRMVLQPSRAPSFAAAAAGIVAAGGGGGGGSGVTEQDRTGLAPAAAAPPPPAAGTEAAAAAPAGPSADPMLIGMEREGSSVSAAAAAAPAMSWDRQQLPMQGTAAVSEGMSFVQGTFGSSMQDAGDSQQQQQQHRISGSTSSTSWSVQLQLLHGDLTNPNLASPGSGFWQAHGLNPGVVDLAACIEVLEHLEPRAVDALGHSVLGGLCPKTAAFTTPNWEYNKVLRGINTGVCWPGPPGNDGHPLRHGDHKFEWTRAEFRAWASTLAQQHGYSVEFVDIGRALQEAQALSSIQKQQQQQRGQEGQGASVDRGSEGAAAAAAAGDAAEVMMSALPSVTPAAPQAAAAAAEAVTAAVMGSAQAGSSTGDIAAAAAVYEGVLGAAEQQQEQREALIAGAVAAVSPGVQGAAAGGATPSEQQQQQETLVMQDPFQDPYQQASLGTGKLGGASQAAVFRLLDPTAAAAAGTGAAAGGGQSSSSVTAGTASVGSTSQRGLSAFWGPMTAVLRVGSFTGAGQTEVDSSLLAQVEVEHF